MIENQTPIEPASATTLVVVGSKDGRLCSSDKAAVTISLATFGRRVVAASPNNDETAMRYAIAAGASQIVGLDFEADLVVFGQGGTLPQGDLLPATLAIQRNAQLIFEVLEFYQRGKQLELIRELGHGNRERLFIKAPVVLVMASTALPQAYVSRLRQMRVPGSLFSRLTTKSNVANEPEGTPWESVRPRTKIGGLSGKTSDSAIGRMFETFGIANIGQSASSTNDLIVDEPEVCATHLIRYLAHHQFIDSDDLVAERDSLNANSLTDKKNRNQQEIEKLKDSNSTPRLPAAIDRGPRLMSGHRNNVNRRPRPYTPR